MGEPDSRTPFTPHGFQHIRQVIRQKYPEAGLGNRDASKRSWRIRAFLNQRTAAILATGVVLTATPAAIYFLVSDKLLLGLGALVTALGAAFGPKIYADFIQPKTNAPATID